MSMPAIKRTMDLTIVGMVVPGLVLTVLFASRHRLPHTVLVGSQPPIGDKNAAPQPVASCATPNLPQAFRLNTTLSPVDAAEGNLPTRLATNQTTDLNAAMLLLVRAGCITSEVLACPTTQPSRWDLADTGTTWNWNDLNGSSALPTGESYSYQSPYAAS
jgi:hypothetical protein